MTSVCLATYNGERFIKQQIDSILCQLDENDELIISDDGSTDKTLEIITSYKDKRVQLLKHIPRSKYSNHEKVSSNFENALNEASGDYIFLSDQDDIWNEKKIEKCLKQLENYDFVVHQMELIDANSNHLKQDTDNYINIIPKNWIKNIIHEKLWGCCFCFNRKLLDCCLPFPEKLIGHDYWISTIAIRNFKCFLLQDELIKYRVHSKSVSYKKATTLWYKVKYRFVLLFQLIVFFKGKNKNGRF